VLKSRFGFRGAAFLVFAFLAIAMTFPLVFHMSERIPGDLEDPLYNVWVMAHNIQKAFEGGRGLWNTNAFYPHQGTLLYADAIMALSAFAWPLSALSGSILFAYNGLFIFSFFLSAAGMFLLVDHLLRDRMAAFLAGLVFAFFPYNFAHLTHLELLFYGWMPFCLLFLHRYFETFKGRDLFIASAFFIVQTLSCAYYGLFFGLALAVLVPVFAFKSGTWREPRFYVHAAACIGLCAAILLPVFVPYIQVHRKMAFKRTPEAVALHSAQLQHFLSVPPGNVLLGRWTSGWGNQEMQIFPGITILAGLGWGWVRRRRMARRIHPVRPLWAFWDLMNVSFALLILYVAQTGGFDWHAGFFRVSMHRLRNPLLLWGASLAARIILDPRLRIQLRNAFRTTSLTPTESRGRRFIFRTYAVLACAAALLCLGPQIRLFDAPLIPGPFGILYDWVPGFDGVRAASRFAVIMMVGSCVVGGWAAAAFLKARPRGTARSALAFGLGIFILIEYASVPLPLAFVGGNEAVPSIYRDVASLPDKAALIELPMPQPLEKKGSEALYMYHSIFHGKRLVNGYSGYTPPGSIIVNRAMDRFPSRSSLDFLKSLDVDYILVHTRGFRAPKGREIVRGLAGFPLRAELIANRDGDFLYRIKPWQVEADEERRGFEEIGRRDLWKAWTRENIALARLAFDGDLETGWATDGPQRPKDFFLLDIGRVVSIDRIEFLLNRRPLTFPRSFRVSASVDSMEWIHLGEHPYYFPFLRPETIEDFSRYGVNLAVEPTALRYLRLTLTGAHPTRPWSIQEIRLFRDPGKNGKISSP